jgi:hypothetical protein
MTYKIIENSVANESREPYVYAKAYPIMSISEFNIWLSKLGEWFFDEPHDFIMDQMINNETATDEELEEYLIKNGANSIFVNELIPMRSYFWDFRYSQNIKYIGL